MNRLCILLILALLGSSLSVRAQVVQKYFGRSGQSGFFTRSTSLTGGERIAVGYSYPNSTSTVGSDALIVCLDASDNVLWAKEFATSGTDRFLNVAPTIDGGCIAVGFVNASGGGTGAAGATAFIARFDVTGTVLWTRRYKNTTNGESLYGVTEMANKHIIASGVYGAGSGSALVVDLDSSGTILWSKSYTANGSNSSYSCMAKGGDIMVVGFFQGATYYDGYVMELNESNGNVKWAHSYDYTSPINSSTSQWPREIRLANNKIYLDAYDLNSYGGTGYTYMHGIVAFDTAGNNPQALEMKVAGKAFANSIYSMTGANGELYLIQHPSDTGFDGQTGTSNTSALMRDVQLTKVSGMNAGAAGFYRWSRTLSTTGRQHLLSFELHGNKIIGYGGTAGDPASAIGLQDALKVEADTSFPITATNCVDTLQMPTFANPAVSLNASFSFNSVSSVTLNTQTTTVSTTAVSISSNTACVPPPTIINSYAAVQARLPCSNTFTVDDATGFSVGDTVLMIQMKGANIDSTNSSSFGNILAYNGAGNYELNVVSSISGNNITLLYQVVRPYNIPAGKVQFVRVACYPSYTVSNTHSCTAWNGTKGGVFAIRVSGTLTLNADINVAGKGFAGGTAFTGSSVPTPCVNDYALGPNTDSSAMKGQGITTVSVNKSYARGKLANGGGGGDSHNSGGGGGSNAGSGGAGGPAYWGCYNNTLTPPPVNNEGGIGGLALTYSTTVNKVFLGGGGGSGQTNNYTDADGASGGGIAFIMASVVASPSGRSIIASGTDASLCTFTTGYGHCDDGMGGGGGGGAVLIQNAGAYIGNINIVCKGGKGADIQGSLNNPWDLYGEGGGGGGGAAWLSGGSIPSNVFINNTGGAYGINVYQNVHWGAQAGAAGVSLTGLNVPLLVQPYSNIPDTISFTDTFIPCYTVKFTNTSISPVGISTVKWDFGSTTSTVANPTYTFAGPGTYPVKLIITNANGCMDSITQNVVIPPAIFPSFSDSLLSCRTYKFTNSSTVASGIASVMWSFGSGATSTVLNPTYSFPAAGTYQVKLVVTGNGGCTDSVIKNVVVLPATPPSFKDTLVSCATYQFTNISTIPAGTASVAWDFGGGATSTSPKPVYTFSGPGNYPVILTVTDNNGCISSVTDTVTVQSPIPPSFTDSLLSCSSVRLINTSPSSFSSFHWDFGMGATSTTREPVYAFPGSGMYTIELSATDSVGCTSSISQTIIIKNGVHADFSWSPTPVEVHIPVQFSNGSTGATRYNWNLGDGTLVTATSPSHTYNEMDTIQVCLVARDDLGCSDSVCKRIAVDVPAAIGIPSAFTPNDDGTNDVLYVKGSGISQMHLIIYNRWGQKVFESNSQDKGWDGTFNGQQQEIDLYAYVLTATFYNNTSVTKKGSINLLR